MTPDFEYFLRLQTIGKFGHTPLGLFVLCLPAGWLSLWLYDRFGREGLEALLPEGWRIPRPPTSVYPPFSTSMAILLGAASHIVWDSFTHVSRWGVDLVPWLSAVVHLGGRQLHLYQLLQHGSTVGGAVILAGIGWKWMRLQPPAPWQNLFRRTLAAGIVLGTAGIINAIAFIPDGFESSILAGAVAVTLTALLAPLAAYFVAVYLLPRSRSARVSKRI